MNKTKSSKDVGPESFMVLADGPLAPPRKKPKPKGYGMGRDAERSLKSFVRSAKARKKRPDG